MMNSIIKINKYFKSLLIVLFWIIIWQIAYMIVGRDLYLPEPIVVIRRLILLMNKRFFWKSISFSIYRVGYGVCLSLILGVILGIISGTNKLVYEILNPAIIAIKSTPVMSFIILALIWFSSSDSPIFICFLMCFPLVWTNIVQGIRNVDYKLLEMAKLYKVRKRNIIIMIYLPSLKPFFLSSMIAAVGLGWKVTVAAEVLSNPRHSIGSNLYESKAYLDIEALFAWTIVVIGLSYIFEVLLTRFFSDKIGCD